MSAPKAEIKSIKKQLFELLENDDCAGALQLLQSSENHPQFNNLLNEKDDDQNSILHHIVAYNNGFWHQMFGINPATIALAKYVISKNPNLTKMANNSGVFPLHLAAYLGDFVMVKILAEADSSTVNMFDTGEYEATPLHFAAYKLSDSTSKDAIDLCSLLLSMRILAVHGGLAHLRDGSDYAVIDVLQNCSPLAKSIIPYILDEPLRLPIDGFDETMLNSPYSKTYKDLLDKLSDVDKILIPQTQNSLPAPPPFAPVPPPLFTPPPPSQQFKKKRKKKKSNQKPTPTDEVQRRLSKYTPHK